MPLVDLSQKHSILNQFISEIRDAVIQKDRMRFRRNMERCGEILAYEISSQLPYEMKEVITPLGESRVNVLKEQPVVGAIMRAGLILHQGLLNYFDWADNAFISAYRKHNPDGSFKIALEYLSCPPLKERILILADPMLATGRSMVTTLEQVFHSGKPKQMHLACVIAAKQGIDFVLDQMPNVTLWVCAVDPELNPQAYIIPGLGDAGDLAYGEKMQH